jgi:hypothetical protein
MAKFKKGDRVRVTDPNSAYFGERGTITDSRNGWSGDPHEVLTIQLERGDGVNLYNRKFTLVSEGEKVMGRRTFKQLREDPTVKAGAIWQEACDDGDQEYVLLNYETHHKGGTRVHISERELVENQPKWFVEVFQVTPQYMTREELDQWEAFKGRKSYGRIKSDLMAVQPARKGRGYVWTPAQKRAHSRRMKKMWAAKRAAKRAA